MGAPTLQIPQDVIEPIIQANITKAILEAMGNSRQIMTQAIAGILAIKVDSNGQPSNYSSNQSWIDWAMGNSIRKAAQAAIEEALKNHQDELQKYLIAELTKKNSPIAKQLVAGMLGAVCNPDRLRYGITVTYEK